MIKKKGGKTMQYLDIYHLGAIIDIKPSSHTDKVVAYIYTRGRQHAEERLNLRTKNVYMTKNDRLRIAGIRVIEEENKLHACCYARTLFEKIEAERKKGGKVYAKELAEQLDKELKKRPVPYFINKDAEDEDKIIAGHTILGAKAFSRLKEDEKTELLEELLYGENQRSF